MAALPLNVQTLFADLAQKVAFSERLPAVISYRAMRGHHYVYAKEKHGDVQVQRFLGRADDDAVKAEVEAIRAEAEAAKERRHLVSLLKRAQVPAPSLAVGKVLEALSRAGYFDRGLILVGTVAYGMYSTLLGHRLSGGALLTQDAGFAVASIPAMNELEIVVDDRRRERGNAAAAADDDDDQDREHEEEDDADVDDAHDQRPSILLPEVLKRADPSFRPSGSLGRAIGGRKQPGGNLPKRFRATASGLEVELLMPLRNRDDEAAGTVPIPAIGAAAIPLKFLDFLIKDAVPTVALYNAGVRVVVPQPAHYAVHKLIVAQERRESSDKVGMRVGGGSGTGGEMAKRTKDLAQARELMSILDDVDPQALGDALDDATDRGPKWKAHVHASLKAIGRTD